LSLVNLGREIRVAVVGSGPAGFYTAEALLSSDPEFQVDVFDSQAFPFGLVRYGVAPDHQKIKSVTRQYDKTASHPKFRFFGGIEIGESLSVKMLKDFYDIVVLCHGSSEDRRLGIDGEDAANSIPATSLVAWYNGHPDFCDNRDR